MRRQRTFDRSRRPCKRHTWRNYLTEAERNNLIFLETRELRARREVTEMCRDIEAMRRLGMMRAANLEREGSSD